MQAAFLLLLNASRIIPQPQFREVLVDVLLWMTECKRFCRNVVLIAGLLGLGIVRDGDGLMRSVLSDVFPCLTLSARAELLKKLWLVDNAAVEEVLDGLLLESCDHAHNPQAVYIPGFVLAAYSQYAEDYLFNSAQSPKDSLFFRFDPAVEKVLFKTLRLLFLLDESSSSLHRAAEVFMAISSRLNQQSGLMARMRLAVVAVHLLELAADCFSKYGDSQRKCVQLIGNDLTLQAIETAVAISPRAMSLYLLSQLKDIAAATAVLQDTALLLRLRISWWQVPMQSEISGSRQLSDGELRAYLAMMKVIRAKLTSIHIATALVRKAKQVYEWRLATLPELLAMGISLHDGAIASKCSDLVKMMLDLDRTASLAASIHIANVLAMQKFVQEKIAFRLRDEDEVRSLLVEKALSLLPTAEEQEGRKLFKKFLDSWEALRRLFATFNICGREVQAAAAIPPLSDEFGENPTRLAHIVEVSGADEHESMPARMLEQRLLKQINDTLSHELLVSLRADKEFNSFEHLADREAPEELLSKLSLAQDSSDNLLTGHSSDTLDDFIMCHAQWCCTSGEVIVPTTEDEGPTIDFVVAMQQARENAARESQLAAHIAGYVLCPNCGMLNERISGCDQLLCGSPYDPHASRVTAFTKTMGALGCGARLSATANRIPRPETQAIVHFQAQVGRIPAALVAAALPKLPQLAPSTGYYAVNFMAIAKHILARIVHHRVRVKTDANFFDPLPLQVKQTNDQKDVSVDAILPAVHMADVFVRLRIAADHLSSVLCCNEEGTRLTAADALKLKRFVSRFGEKRLTTFCEQLLQLCSAALTRALSDDHMDEEFTLSTCKQLMDGTKCKWDAVLRKELANNAFTLPCLPEIAHIFAAADAEGGVSAQASFKAELPAEDVDRHGQLRRDLQRSADDDALLTSCQEELQILGSLLAASEGGFLKLKDRSLLKDSKALRPFLVDKGHALSAQVLGKLCVCHLGAVMRFIRQTVGFINYCKLSRRFKPQQVKAHAGGMDEAAQQMDVYNEFVPEEWIALQDLTIDLDGQFTMTAAALLRQQQDEKERLQFTPMDEGDEHIAIACAIAADAGDKDCGMPSEEPRSAVPSTLAVAQIQSTHHLLSDSNMFKDLPTAWEVLTRWRSSVPALEEIIGSLGLEMQDDLALCQPAEVKTMAEKLPRIPQRKVLHAMLMQQRAPSSLGNLQAAWEVLMSPATPAGVRKRLMVLGFVPGDQQLDAGNPSDLAFLDEVDVDSLLAHLKAAQRKKVKVLLSGAA